MSDGTQHLHHRAPCVRQSDEGRVTAQELFEGFTSLRRSTLRFGHDDRGEGRDDRLRRGSRSGAEGLSRQMGACGTVTTPTRLGTPQTHGAAEQAVREVMAQERRKYGWVSGSMYHDGKKTTCSFYPHGYELAITVTVVLMARNYYRLQSQSVAARKDRK